MKTLGIDLGTTNSVAAVNGRVIDAGVETEGSGVIPSVVAFPPNGKEQFGHQAHERRLIDPKNTLFSTKRIIGQPWRSHSSVQFRKGYPFDMIENGAGTTTFKTRAGEVTPLEVAARILRNVSAGLDMSEHNTVVTVPAGFGEEARSATQLAAEQAGLGQVHILDEPVATAMAYMSLVDNEDRYVAVYDFGGGTFDLAVLECEGDAVAVKGHGGDPYLGGDDLDRQIADWVAEQVLREVGWDLTTDRVTKQRLVGACELAKIKLCTQTEVNIDLSEVDPAGPQAKSISIDQGTLGMLCGELMQRSFLLCDRVLGDAGLRNKDIGTVFLAGGGTMLPMVRDGVAAYFGARPRSDLNPMQVVGLGASLAGG